VSKNAMTVAAKTEKSPRKLLHDRARNKENVTNSSERSGIVK